MYGTFYNNAQYSRNTVSAAKNIASMYYAASSSKQRALLTTLGAGGFIAKTCQIGLTSGESVTMALQVIDTCADSDCNGCCTANLGGLAALVDFEFFSVKNSFPTRNLVQLTSSGYGWTSIVNDAAVYCWDT